MAINPISNSSFLPELTTPATANASSQAQTAQTQAASPTAQLLQALEGSAADPMLSGATTNPSSISSEADSSLLSLLDGGSNSASAGDSLLSLLDGSSSSSTTAGSSMDGTLLSMLDSSSSDSSVSNSFNTMSGEDPLLADLNALDAGGSTDASQNQDLGSFLMQQAASSYTAGQNMGGGTTSGGSTGALGQTTA